MEKEEESDKEKSGLEWVKNKLRAMGVKVVDEKQKKRKKFHDEVELPPHLQAVFDYAVNYANKWDMIEKGIYKPTLVELDQMRANKVKLRIQDGKIIKVTPVEEEEENT